MLSNSDIFDEDELQAIADDDSSSSSCHMSFSGGAEEDGIEGEGEGEDNARLPRSSSAASAASEAEKAGAEHDVAVAGRSDRVERVHATSKVDGESAPTPSVRNSGACGEEDDDDSDDDEFFGSWCFGNEGEGARASAATAPPAPPDSDPTREGAQEEAERRPCAAGEVEVELGASVLRWISRSGSAGGVAAPLGLDGPSAFPYGHDGIAAVRLGEIDGKSHSRSNTMLRLVAPAPHREKRPRAAGNHPEEAIIEEIAGGDVVSRRRARLRGAAPPGTTVDCLARYDRQRGRYVLDIVEVTTDPPESLPSVEVPGAGRPAKRTMENVDGSRADTLDPRSALRRAEDQVRKLKRGKGGAKAKTKSKETEKKTHGDSTSADC